MGLLNESWGEVQDVHFLGSNGAPFWGLEPPKINSGYRPSDLCHALTCTVPAAAFGLLHKRPAYLVMINVIYKSSGDNYFDN